MDSIMPLTPLYLKEKRCQMEAAYNMMLGDTKNHQFRYNVCMAREEKPTKIPYNRPKYTVTPSD